MDAWETLVAGSTLLDGDAWEHLNAQGGGGAAYFVLADGLAVDVAMSAAVTVSLASSVVDVAVGAGIAVDVAGIEVGVALLSPEVRL